MTSATTDRPHRRFNLLSGDWVLVSPHRSQRPWQGQIEPDVEDSRPQHDESCYLCAGNERANGLVTPRYVQTYVFDNDFPALFWADDEHGIDGEADELLRSQPEHGVCRVVCFSPRHDLSLAELDVTAITKVVDLWSNQYRQLAADPVINHVQIFENKGAAMGCSNPHPHGQIWAQQSVPNEPAAELKRMQAYYAEHGSTLLGD